MKHYSEMKVEKTGDNLEEIEKEIELSAIEKEKQLKEIS